MGDPEEQSDLMAKAQMELMQREAQFAQQEQALDEEVPVEEVDESIQ
jgi:hypothetical protein